MYKITSAVKKEIENIAATLPPVTMASKGEVKGIDIMTNDKYKDIRSKAIKLDETYIVREAGAVELVSYKRRMIKLFHLYGPNGIRNYVFEIRKKKSRKRLMKQTKPYLKKQNQTITINQSCNGSKKS